MYGTFFQRPKDLLQTLQGIVACITVYNRYNYVTYNREKKNNYV